MIFSEDRYPPRIKCGAGFFGIVLSPSNGTTLPELRHGHGNSQ